MSFYVNDNIKKLKRIKSKEDRSGYLRLDMNENPEGLPKDFVDSVLAKINSRVISMYPQKNELIDLLAKENEVESWNITITNGSDEAIRLILETFGENNKNIVTVSPSFEMYDVYSKMFGINNIKISYDENLNIDVNTVVESIDDNTRIVVILNPNSPIGNVFSAKDMMDILDKAQKCNSIVVIDEAYYGFAEKSFEKFIKKYNNVLCLRTFSKLYSIAGLRIGYIIGNEELIQYIENAESTYNVNSIGILFAEEILKNKELKNRLIETEKLGHKYAVEQLKNNNYQIYSAYGNYILFKSKLSPYEVANKLQKSGILVKTYRNGVLSEYIRITTGSIDIMERFIKELLLADI